MPTSALKLAADLEKFLASQVQQGTYPTRMAAISAAVAHEKRRAEQRVWLQGELQKGLDSGSTGELDWPVSSDVDARDWRLGSAGRGVDAAAHRSIPLGSH
jgi:hypothetical protein